jgi:hypothetical protein
MATSGQNKASPNSSLRQEGSATNKGKQPEAKAKGSNQKEFVKGQGVQVPLHSYSPDVSPEFQERIDQFIQDSNDSLRSALARQAMGESKDTPFASVREGDKINIVVPLTMSRGDMLAELILLLASKVPTAVLLEGSQGWEEPQWTSESSRHLMGIVSAIQAPPASLSSSSSPVDLARLAVWVTACNSALSVPGGVETAVGSVLPTSVGGAKSASKYLSKVFGALRAISSEEKHTQAIKTLDMLLKLWIKSQHTVALDLVRKNKISWGTVLLAGSPTEKKKVKGQEITLVKAPSKPSRSPYLSGKERQELSSLLASAWNTPDQLRTTWNRLSPEEQHQNYSEYIIMLKKHYENINKISTTVHSKLGHRKKWIHNACEDKDAVPMKKKDKSNEFIWTANFFKLDLTEINISVALVFSPHHYLTDSKYDGDNIITRLFNRRKVIDASDTTEHLCGVTVGLWREWAMRFEPDLSTEQGSVPAAVTLEDQNPYADLPEASA